MMNHDLLAEVFHREIVKQEEAQKRRKQQETHEAEILALRDELHAVQMSHNNEKIKMRWEHADEVRGGGLFFFVACVFFAISAFVLNLFHLAAFFFWW